MALHTTTPEQSKTSMTSIVTSTWQLKDATSVTWTKTVATRTDHEASWQRNRVHQHAIRHNPNLVVAYMATKPGRPWSTRKTCSTWTTKTVITSTLTVHKVSHHRSYWIPRPIPHITPAQSHPQFLSNGEYTHKQPPNTRSGSHMQARYVYTHQLNESQPTQSFRQRYLTLSYRCGKSQQRQMGNIHWKPVINCRGR